MHLFQATILPAVPARDNYPSAIRSVGATGEKTLTVYQVPLIHTTFLAQIDEIVPGRQCSAGFSKF